MENRPAVDVPSHQQRKNGKNTNNSIDVIGSFKKLWLEADAAALRTGRGGSGGPRIDEGGRGSLKEDIVCDRMAIISFLHVALSVHLQWSPHMVPFTLGGTFNRPRGYFRFRCSEAKQMKAVAYL